MRHRAFSVFCCVAILSSAVAAEGALYRVADKAPPVAKMLDLRQVRLLEGPLKTAQEADCGWLLRLDPERLLHNFRATAGLPSSAAPYGGWEDPKCEVRGHSLGHYLTACSLMFAATGEAEMRRRADHIVAELAKCQAAMPGKGFAPGYLAGFPQSLFDRVDAAQPVWAPYYTLHKLYAGLLDAHKFCDNTQALTVLRGMAEWLDGRFGKLTREQQQKSLANEHGGMAESLAELYARTGEPRYLKLAEAFRHDAVFEPAAHGEDTLTRLHANTQFPKFIGYQRIYELTGSAEYHTAAKDFWTFVTRDRSFVIGGNSTHEHFFPVDKWEEQMRTLIGPETCNTYNMLKLTARLWQADPAAALADFYERALLNHICSSQHPGDGNVVYYTSLRPGSYRNYSHDDQEFWCCVGTGMENPARYAEAIYAQGSGRLFVNQFIASEAELPEWGLTLRQETQFPAEPHSMLKLKLRSPQTFTLAIRKPVWVEGDGLQVAVNGTPEQIKAAANGYVELVRQWHDGDTVAWQLPLRLTVEPLPHSEHFVAILYGPLVLAARLGREGLRDADFRGQMAAPAKVLPLEHVPALLAPSTADVLKNIEPVAGRPLEFRLKNVGSDYRLIPFAALHDERYTVYWPLFADEASWQKYVAQSDPIRRLREQYAQGSIDFVLPDAGDIERVHRIHSDKSHHGEAIGRPWRDAHNGGWFSYELKCNDGQRQKVVVTYWGSDAGARVFDVLVDGKKLATQKLARNKPNEFFDVEYELPVELTTGKDHILLRFQAHANSMAGGVFGVRIVRAE